MEKKTLLVIGGAGFIGSNFIRKYYNDYKIICVDALTYASNYDYIKDLVDDQHIKFYQGKVEDNCFFQQFFVMNPEIHYIINFAAETHVDTSIASAEDHLRSFVFSDHWRTNVLGIIALLENLMHWTNKVEKFVYVSTDEVYGSLELDDTRSFSEQSPMHSNNPYSATKACAEALVTAWGSTYGVPAIITNCSNNYGPNQASEKFIPTILNAIKNGEKIPVYGDGLNVRDWLFVDDHNAALKLVLDEGVVGERYCIGGGQEVANIDLVKAIIKACNSDESMIEYVTDRKGHDRRYAIDCSKITNELGYEPSVTLEEGLAKTIEWYANQ